MTTEIDVGVAFWAHLGGFAAGVITALLVKRLARGELADRLESV
jgi:membrane associated rhomboid family serine protease